MMRERAADLALAARLQAGDESAVEELTSVYGPMVKQLAFRYMKNWEDAEEVTQDVLMKVVQKSDLFRGESALSSWIYRITFNAAMSRLRNGRFSRPNEVLMSDITGRRDERMDEMPAAFDAADWSNLGDDAVMRRQLRERVIDALRDMPAVYRVPVILRDLRGMSTEEASRLLRVKTQTLKSRLHRGRTFLRSRLQEFAGGLSLHGAEPAR